MAKKSSIFDSTIEFAENYTIWGFIKLTILAVLRPNSIVEKSRSAVATLILRILPVLSDACG